MPLSIAMRAFLPLKFQAGMGVLLAFMFLVNMFGAILLLSVLQARLFRPAKGPPART